VKRRPLLVLAIASVLLVSACGDDANGDTAAGSESGVVADVVANPGLQLLAVDFTLGSVAILNTSNEEISTEGFWLCSQGAYVQIDPQPIAARSSILFQLDDLGELDPADGELALYRSDDFDSVDAIHSYVEWGSTGHQRSALATEAGIWVPGGFVESDASSALLTNIDPTGFDVVNWVASED